MGITIHSPHSGRPVTIRDKDVGRAVRDEENRIFYVLLRSSGEGYYAAITRAGGKRDEIRYDEMLAKQDQAKTTGAERSHDQIYDARGKPRKGRRGKLVVLFLAVVVIVLAVLFFPGYGIFGDWQKLGQGVDQSEIEKKRGEIEDEKLKERQDSQSFDDASLPTFFTALTNDDSPDSLIPDRIRNTAPPEPKTDEWVETESSLRWRLGRAPHDVKSAPAKEGDAVAMHYIAKVRNGRRIESTYDDQNNPYTFVIGTGRVIDGLDEGVRGMRAGEIRHLIVKPDLAYAKRTPPPRVNQNDTIEMTVELIRIEPGIDVLAQVGEDESAGTARFGDRVEVDFNLFLPDGTLADSTYQRGKPLAVTIGERKVIAGMEVGIIGMNIGEMRTISIPPNLAYGEKGAGDMVPPNATLQMEIVLKKIVEE